MSPHTWEPMGGPYPGPSDFAGILPMREEIERCVTNVLAADALPAWWETPLPRMHNATPQQIFDAGDGWKLLVYVRGYLDESFS